MSHEGAAAAAAKRSKDEERAERSIYLFTLDSSFRKWYVAQTSSGDRHKGIILYRVVL